MKKFISKAFSAIAALILFVGMAFIGMDNPSNVNAAGEQTVITVSSISEPVELGSDISLSVTIANNPGFAGARFNIQYDSNVLTPKSKLFKLGSAVKEAVLEEETNMSLTANTYALLSADDFNFEGNGEILKIEFTVNENASVNSTEVSLCLFDNLAKNFNDINGNPVPVSFVSGSIALDVDLSGKEVTFYGADLETSIGSIFVDFDSTLESINLPTPIAQSGKVFAGWYTSKPTENGTKVTPNTKLDVYEAIRSNIDVYPVFVNEGNEIYIEETDGTISACSTFKAAINGASPVANNDSIIRLVSDVNDSASGSELYDISSLTSLHVDLNGHSINLQLSADQDWYCYVFKMGAQLVNITFENTCLNGKLYPQISGGWNAVFGVPNGSSSTTSMSLSLNNIQVSGSKLVGLDSARTLDLYFNNAKLNSSAIINTMCDGNGSSTYTTYISCGSSWITNIDATIKNKQFDLNCGTLVYADGYTRVVLHPEWYAQIKNWKDESLGYVYAPEAGQLDVETLNSFEINRDSELINEGATRRYYTFVGWATTNNASEVVNLSDVTYEDTLYPVFSYVDKSTSEVVEFNGSKYSSINDALQAAIDGNVTGVVQIKLIQDSTEFVILTEETPNVVIDLNGNTLSLPTEGKSFAFTDGDNNQYVNSAASVFSFVHETETDAFLTIKDSSNDKSGTVKIATYEWNGYFFATDVATMPTSIEVNIENGNFLFNINKSPAFKSNHINGSVFNITGGTFMHNISALVNTDNYNVVNDGLYYTVSEKHVHNWCEPVFTWEDDGSLCSASISCTKNGCSDYIEAYAIITSTVKTPATCTTKGVTRYTATVNLGGSQYIDYKEIEDINILGHNYVDHICTRCGELDDEAKFYFEVLSENLISLVVGNDYNLVVTLPEDGNVNTQSMIIRAIMQNVASLDVNGVKEHQITVNTGFGDKTVDLEEWLSNAYSFEGGKIVATIDGKAVTYTFEAIDSDLRIEGNTNTEAARTAWQALTSHITTSTQDNDDSFIEIANGSYIKIGTEYLRFETNFEGNLVLNNLSNLSGLEDTIRDAVCLDTCANQNGKVTLFVKAGTKLAVGQTVAILDNDYMIEVTGDAQEMATLNGSLTKLRDTTGGYNLAKELVSLFNKVIGVVDASSQVNVSMHVHELVHHDAKAPTCTEIGWEAYDTCEVCGYTSYQEIAVLGHKLVHNDLVYPTSNVNGHIEYYECSECHELFLDAACTKPTTAQGVLLTLETATVISTKELNNTGRTLMFLNNNWYTYTNNATYKSVSLQFVWDLKNLTTDDRLKITNSLTTGDDPNWTVENTLYIITDKDLFRIYRDASHYDEVKNLGLTKGLHTINYTRQAIMNGDVCTNDYVVTVVIDGVEKARVINHYDPSTLMNRVFINSSKNNNVLYEKDYVPETYEQAVTINLGDYTQYGYIRENNTWSDFKYNANNNDNSRIYKFTVKVNEFNSSTVTSMEINKGSCNFKVNTDKGYLTFFFAWTVNGRWSDRYFINGDTKYVCEAGDEFDIEIGRLRVTSGINQGKDLVYLKVNGQYLKNSGNQSYFYCDLSASDANKFTSNSNKISYKLVNCELYGYDYVTPTYEKADVISVNDLYYAGKYQNGSIDLLDVAPIVGKRNYTYLSTTKYGSVVFKGVFNMDAAHFTSGHTDGTQIRFDGSWDNQDMFWVFPNGIMIVNDNNNYVTGTKMPLNQDVDVEIGRLAIMNADGTFSGKHYLYVKFDGKYALEYITSKITEAKYTSHTMSVTIKEANQNHIIKNVALNKTVTIKAGSNTQQVSVLRSSLVNIPTYGTDVIPTTKRIDGWKISGTNTAFNPLTDRVTGDMTIEAIIVDNNWNVVFGSETFVVDNGEVIVAPTTIPTKAPDAAGHYSFNCWVDANGNPFVAGTVASKHVTYTAKFDTVAHTITHHDAKAASCIEAGWEAYDTCSVCGYTSYKEIAALGHELTHYEAKEPTTTSTGNIEYWVCSRCNKYYKDAQATQEIAANSVVLAKYTTEAPQYVSVSDLKKDGVYASTISGGGNYEYSLADAPTNKSVVFFFNLEYVASKDTQIYIYKDSNQNWNFAGYVWLQQNGLAYGATKADGTLDKHLSANYGYSLVDGQIYAIEYGRLAIMNGNTFTGKYHVYVKIDGKEVFFIDQAIESCVSGGGRIHTTSTMKYSDAYELENAKHISVSDLKLGGSYSNVSQYLSSHNDYLFDNDDHAANYSLVFEFDYYSDQPSERQFHFYSNGTYKWSGLTSFILKSTSAHLGKGSKAIETTGWHNSSFTMAANTTYHVEYGRQALMHGDSFTGRYYVYLKVNGNIIKDEIQYLPAEYVKGNYLFTTGNKDTGGVTRMIDSSYSTLKYETADVISVNDLCLDNTYQNGQIGLLEGKTYNYLSTTQYGSVVFKSVFNFPVYNVEACQVRFDGTWENPGMVWFHGSAGLLYFDTNGKQRSCPFQLPASKDVNVEYGRLAILNADGSFSGKHYFYLKFDGVTYIDTIVTGLSESKYKSNKMFFTGKDYLNNYVIKNVEINKTVTVKAGTDTKQVNVLRSGLVTIPTYGTDVIPLNKKIESWKISGTDTVFNPLTDRITSDITIEAVIVDFNWDITFGSETVTVANGDAIVAPTTIPTKVADATGHYVFDCWVDADGNSFATGKVATKEVTYTAKFTTVAHTYGEWQTITAATCTTEGQRKRVCECGYEEFETIPVIAHTLTHHDAKAPTCTEIGWEAYDTCSECEYTTYVEKALLGHDHVHHDAKAPTCTEIGWDAYDTCSRCEYTTYVEKAAKGHTLAEAVEENRHEATCLEAGSYDVVVYCSDCHAEISRVAQVIPALGHELVHHEGKAATCTEKGFKAYDTCSRCEYTTYEEIPALGHSYQFVAEVAATYETTGVKAHYVCTTCGKIFVLENENYVETSLANLVIDKLQKQEESTSSSSSSESTSSESSSSEPTSEEPTEPEPEKGCFGGAIPSIVGMISLMVALLVSKKRRQAN